MITLINGDFRDVLEDMDPVHMIFADPPDNINLRYGDYNDRQSEAVYRKFLQDILILGTKKSNVLWVSYNAIHTHLMGHLIYCFFGHRPDWEVKPCVQTYTFGQHNQRDLGIHHRPLVRIMRKGTMLYPDAVRVPSWRQLHKDKRADPRGRVPGDVFDLDYVSDFDDVFDFTRVTGNSKQRRSYHPTQLNEGLYERCIRLTCKPTDTVCDMFAGTGTMARACKTTGNPCTLIEVDTEYCEKIAHEHKLHGFVTHSLN